MRRRDFIKVIAGSAAAWPIAAHAQQPDKVRRVGVLISGAETDAEYQARLAAFRERLQQLGWTEGRNVRFDYRWAAGIIERMRAYASELARLTPDVILAIRAFSVWVDRGRSSRGIWYIVLDGQV